MLYNVVTNVPDRNELIWGCVNSPGVFPVGLERFRRLSGSWWICRMIVDGPERLGYLWSS